jgi:hypothetical protein
VAPNITDLHLNHIARHHVAVGALGAHPYDVAWVEGHVLGELVYPSGGVPYLFGGGEVLQHLAVVAHDDAKARVPRPARSPKFGEIDTPKTHVDGSQTAVDTLKKPGEIAKSLVCDTPKTPCRRPQNGR